MHRRVEPKDPLQSAFGHACCVLHVRYIYIHKSKQVGAPRHLIAPSLIQLNLLYILFPLCFGARAIMLARAALPAFGLTRTSSGPDLSVAWHDGTLGMEAY